jgi:hypothetical protein
MGEPQAGKDRSLSVEPSLLTLAVLPTPVKERDASRPHCLCIDDLTLPQRRRVLNSLHMRLGLPSSSYSHGSILLGPILEQSTVLLAYEVPERQAGPEQLHDDSMA